MRDILAEYLEKDLAQEGARILVYSTRRHPVFGGSGFVGGLADRLKGVITSFYAAAASNRRFLLHWPTPIDITEDLLPGAYDWRFPNAEQGVIAHPDLRHLDLIDDRSDVLDNIDFSSVEQDLFGGARAVVMNINRYKFAPIRQWVEQQTGARLFHNDLFARAFKTLFAFKPNDMFAQNRAAITEGLQGAQTAIGVHLRTGSGNGWTDPDMDDWRNYETILEFAFRQAEDAKDAAPAFYFLSDSLKAREAVLSRDWPCPVITTLDRVSHLDRSEGFDAHAHHLTFFEFEMLSGMDRIVCGKGAFAALASMVGGGALTRYV